jgi:hypothetical protein
MTANEISSAIIQGKFTNEELNHFTNAVTYARNYLQVQVRRQLEKGMQVSFKSGRSGRVIQGTVRKVNIKFAEVDTPAGGYKVPMNMLEVV